MQNSDAEGRNFISAPNTHVWFFFLHTFQFRMFYFKSIVTSQWRQPDDKVTWRPIQPMQTEFTWNFSFFILPMGEITWWDKNFYPNRKARISLYGMQERLLWHSLEIVFIYYSPLFKLTISTNRPWRWDNSFPSPWCFTPLAHVKGRYWRIFETVKSRILLHQFITYW